MAHAFKHAQSSAKKFGGAPKDYLAVHRWFDGSIAFFPDFRQLALRHHAEGIFLAERIFGVTVLNLDGAAVPIRYLGEQHLKEDLGRVPGCRGLASANPSRTLDVRPALVGTSPFER